MPTTFTKIAGSTLTGTASAFVFSGIPATYTNLYFIGSMRTNRASALEGLRIRFNGDSGTNYLFELAQQYQGGSGLRTESTFFTNMQSYIYGGTASSANQTANFFSVFDVLIPNYAGNKYKRAIINSGSDTTSTSNFMFQTDQTNASWGNTSAITDITVEPTDGGLFVANSSLFLYGTYAG